MAMWCMIHCKRGAKQFNTSLLSLLAYNPIHVLLAILIFPDIFGEEIIYQLQNKSLGILF